MLPFSILLHPTHHEIKANAQTFEEYHLAEDKHRFLVCIMNHRPYYFVSDSCSLFYCLRNSNSCEMLLHYSHDTGIVCPNCKHKLNGCNANSLAAHLKSRHGIRLPKATAQQYATKVSALSDAGPKKEKAGFHCYECGKVALERCNLDQIHSNPEKSGCVNRDICECLLLEDSVGRLSLHSVPAVSYLQSQHPLWLPDIYSTKTEVVDSTTKATYRERLRNKIKDIRLRVEAYRTRRAKAENLFKKGRRHYVPFTFYNEVRKGKYSKEGHYVYGSIFCPSVDDANGLPTPDSTAPKIIDMTNKKELVLKIHLGDGTFT